jgi:hypothetical protein
MCSITNDHRISTLTHPRRKEWLFNYFPHNTAIDKVKDFSHWQREVFESFSHMSDVTGLLPLSGCPSIAGMI